MFELSSQPPSSAGGDDPGGLVVDEVAAAEFAECSGAILAKLVADAMAGVPNIPDSPAGDGRLLDLITATTRIDAWSEAIRSRLTALLYSRTLGEHRRFGLVAHPDGRQASAGASHGFDDVAFTRSEVAANLSLELGRSLPVADRDLGLALGLARTPTAQQALGAGRMDPAQARAMVGELDHVPDPELRLEVAAALATDPQTPDADQVLVRELRDSRRRLWDLPPAQIRAIVRREVADREPELAAERSRREVDGRHVRYHALRDGMAELVLHGPAITLAAAHRRLDGLARAARRAGTSLTTDQLRHDIASRLLVADRHPPGAVDDVAGEGSGAVRAMVNVTVAATTLLALDDQPATLHGPAGPQPLPAELARRLAYDPDQATWRRILLDPASGVATDVSDCYRPPRRMAEFVTVRDGFTSRFPTSSAGHVELDHVQPYDHAEPAAGGATTGRNLASAGRLDHHLKTDGALSVSGDANDRLVYRMNGTGEFASYPYQYADPRAPQPESPDERAQPP